MTKQWDKYRDIIVAEYKHLNKPLREVQRVMLQRYGFRASTRAYRSRFDRWGIHKYSRRRRLRTMSLLRRCSDSDVVDVEKYEHDHEHDHALMRHNSALDVYHSPGRHSNSSSSGCSDAEDDEVDVKPYLRLQEQAQHQDGREGKHVSYHPSNSSSAGGSVLSILAPPNSLPTPPHLGLTTSPGSISSPTLAMAGNSYTRSTLTLAKTDFPYTPTTPSPSPIISPGPGGGNNHEFPLTHHFSGIFSSPAQNHHHHHHHHSIPGWNSGGGGPGGAGSYRSHFRDLLAGSGGGGGGGGGSPPTSPEAGGTSLSLPGIQAAAGYHHHHHHQHGGYHHHVPLGLGI